MSLHDLEYFRVRPESGVQVVVNQDGDLVVSITTLAARLHLIGEKQALRDALQSAVDSAWALDDSPEWVEVTVATPSGGSLWRQPFDDGLRHLTGIIDPGEQAVVVVRREGAA